MTVLGVCGGDGMTGVWMGWDGMGSIGWDGMGWVDWISYVRLD